MAPRKLSPAPTTLTGTIGAACPRRILIFRHQQRPLISKRERNDRSRAPFYEVAAGRDLFLLALQPGCRQLSEFPAGSVSQCMTPASNAAFKAGPELSRTNRAPACFVVRAIRA